MLQAFTILRSRRKSKLKLHNDLYPYWVEQAYITGNSVMLKVQQEQYDEKDDASENDFAIKGKGDSGAFSVIYEYMRENQLRAKND